MNVPLPYALNACNVTVLSCTDPDAWVTFATAGPLGVLAVPKPAEFAAETDTYFDPPPGEGAPSIRPPGTLPSPTYARAVVFE